MTLAAGQSVTISKTKTFPATEPTDSWYAYLTYVTPDGVYHDGTNVAFTVNAASPAKIVVTSPLALSAKTVKAGGSLTGTAQLTNQGGTAITLPRIVIAVRPPGGTHADGPYLDLGSLDNVTISPGQTVTITKTKSFAATDPKGAWYAYLTYVTPDGVYHDGTNVDFTVTS
ncbi:hypothetical protein [Cohnella sp. REN36]|uniref:hypothetical protein n=1 Tax=Cohnella sp. REN36 TaxID=2887347 RepID=UPI001D15065E|nr:hypothetical protein [Cohnella sp. REN36]MCC3376102.1 hypothetical protein [Cohnella sp. REN36]